MMDSWAPWIENRTSFSSPGFGTSAAPPPSLARAVVTLEDERTEPRDLIAFCLIGGYLTFCCFFPLNMVKMDEVCLLDVKRKRVCSRREEITRLHNRSLFQCEPRRSVAGKCVLGSTQRRYFMVFAGYQNSNTLLSW